MFETKPTRAAWWKRIAALRAGDDAGFGALALELFAWQLRRNPALRSWARRSGGLSPASWLEIPAVPQELFKSRTLFCHPAAKARHLYRTSGTTTGRPGFQRLLSDDLYRASALRAAGSLAPFGRPMPLLFLTPSPKEAPHSSLAAMFGFFRKAWGTAGSTFFVSRETLRIGRLEKALAASKRPVGLCGTAFSFVHLLDAPGGPVRLPKGSFILETGGFKGRSRELEKGDLYRALSARFGVADRDIWNEYGMTELSSQAYARGAKGEHRAPPWARGVIVDPATGKPVRAGGRGLVRWIDLANVDGVLALETQDLAVRTKAGFRLIGRLPSLPKRGCSLDAEELIPA